MWVVCDTCQRSYDDAKQWTICPHSPLGCAIDDLCPKCDTLKSIHGPCEHQQDAPASVFYGVPVSDVILSKPFTVELGFTPSDAYEKLISSLDPNESRVAKPDPQTVAVHFSDGNVYETECTINGFTQQDVPANWWNRFKDRWFPSWLKRWSPVKYATMCTVDFKPVNPWRKTSE